MPRFSTRTVEPPKPPPPAPREEYEGSRHNMDCESNLSNEVYDSRCLRCTKIKKVISLRRKQVKYGASILEAKAAYELAGKLIDDYELTRGETFDKKYQEISIPPAPKARRGSASKEKVADNFDTI